MRGLVTPLALLLAGSAACGEAVQPVNCPDDLRYVVSPDSSTLAVGQSFIPLVTALGCGGTEVLESPKWHWRSSDSLVVRIDSASGRATAQSAGAATIYPTWTSEGSGFGIPVTVR